MSKRGVGSPTRDDEELYDERPPLIRWGRIAAAFAMIFAAIILLVIDNHFGIVSSTPAPTATPRLTRVLPLLGTPQPMASATVNVKLLARGSSIGSLHAPDGSEYLLIAVQVTNTGSRALPLQPKDFTVRSAGHVLAVGAGYGSHAASLITAGLAPGKRVEGTLTFLVPVNVPNLVLDYAPSGVNPASGALWSLP